MATDLYVYSSNGLVYRGAPANYVAQAGEVTFDHLASPAELAAAFPGYTAAVNAAAAPTMLASKLAAGIAITSTGTPALNATYALDDLTLSQIGSVAQDAADGLGLPGEGNTFIYPDINSIPRTFTSVQIQALYKAMRDLVFQLQTQAAIQAAGGTPAWPVQSAVIA